MPLGNSSTIFYKQVLSLAGLFWLFFVAVHMLGNLLVFAGPEAYNTYGYFLEKSYFTKLFEVLLLASLIAHVFFGIQITWNNRKKTENSLIKKYGSEKQSSLIKSSLIFQGLFLLAFIVQHLIFFKFWRRSNHFLWWPFHEQLVWTSC